MARTFNAPNVAALLLSGLDCPEAGSHGLHAPQRQAVGTAGVSDLHEALEAMRRKSSARKIQRIARAAAAKASSTRLVSKGPHAHTLENDKALRAATTIQSGMRARLARGLFGVMQAVKRSTILLGDGSFGKVWLSNGADGTPIAIKEVTYVDGMTDDKQVQREALMMRKVQGHANVLKLLGAHYGLRSAYLVFEYCDGGDAFNYLISNDALSEAEALHMFLGLLDAVQHMHAAHVVHGDIKLENLLLAETRTCSRIVKLGDFGHALPWWRNEHGQTVDLRVGNGGTPGYAAPEALASVRTGVAYSATAADAWACGVVLYVLMLRFFPFKEASPACPTFAHYFQAAGLYTACEYIPHTCAASISDTTKRVLNGLLTIDPRWRMTVSCARELLRGVGDEQPVPALRHVDDMHARVARKGEFGSSVKPSSEASEEPATPKAGSVALASTSADSASSSSAPNSPETNPAAPDSPEAQPMPPVTSIGSAAGSTISPAENAEGAFSLYGQKPRADGTLLPLLAPVNNAESPFPYCNMVWAHHSSSA